MTQATGYTRAQIVLHWITVLLVALQFVFSDGMSEAFEESVEAGARMFSAPAVAHIAGGVLILVLSLWRLLLRRSHGAPPPPAGEPAWAARLAVIAHKLFYVLLILMPLSGAVAWNLTSESAGEVHEFLKSLLLALIVAHIGAVIVHHAVWKTGLIDRMKRPAS